MGADGIFHTAIEIHGKEYSFGFAAISVCGILNCKPTVFPTHTFCESVYLGDIELSPKQVQGVLNFFKNPSGWRPVMICFVRTAAFSATNLQLNSVLGVFQSGRTFV
jgi:hypothetical protein